MFTNRTAKMASVCTCRNSCNRVEKRGACPCRQAGRSCGELCTCGTNRVVCVNRCEVMDTNPAQDFHEKPSSNSPLSPFTPPQETTRKRKKTNPGTSAKRRLIMEAAAAETMEWEATQKHTNSVAEFVNQQDLSSLRRITTELLLRTPSAFADYRGGYSGPTPEPPSPTDASPDWCKCGNCRPMPTAQENKCCHKDQKGAVARGQCATSTELFRGTVLNPTFVNAMMAGYFDLLAHEEEGNNATYRYHAYRSYIFLAHGPLGSRNRRVVPSCCVLAIQRRYPDPNGQYTGFKPI